MRESENGLLSAEDQERIRGCVEAAEKSTSGEIVPMVVPASSRYPAAAPLGALVVGLVLAVAATALESLRKPWGPFTMLDLWLFPAVLAVAFAAAHELIRRVGALKRLFVTHAEMEDEVQEAALTAFYRQGLAATRDRTGILIFVSLFERRACVLADKGINDKVQPGAWKELVDLVAQGFGSRAPAEAICRAVTRCGEVLSTHFPVRPDDTNELRNIITET
jgi:putative membrane protein